MVQADAAAFGDGRGVWAHLDQQEFVVGPPGGERGRGHPRDLVTDQRPPENVAIELHRPGKIAHVQHDVPQFLDADPTIGPVAHVILRSVSSCALGRSAL